MSTIPSPSKELTTTYSKQIDDYYKGNSRYRGCLFFQDLKTIKDGFYFINIENQHWQLLYNDKKTKTVSYMDPFGTYPPGNIVEQMTRAGDTVTISQRAVQGVRQSNCGWICIYVCDQLIRGRLLDDVMSDFTNDTTRNELRLRTYFTHIARKDGRENLDFEGDGIIDFILDREPVSVKLFMMRYGSESIDYIEVVKEPVVGVIQKLANWISRGELEKNKAKLGYDDLMHDYIIINKKYRLERNETVAAFVDRSYSSKSSAKIQVISRFKNQAKSIKDLLERAEKKYGSSIYRYDPKTNNCQIFVKQLLTASGMWDSWIEQFVIQDTDKLLSKELNKKLKYITDTGGVLSKLSHFIPWVSWASNLKTLFG